MLFSFPLFFFFFILPLVATECSGPKVGCSQPSVRLDKAMANEPSGSKIINPEEAVSKTYMETCVTFSSQISVWKRVLHHIIFWVLRRSKGQPCRDWNKYVVPGTSEGRLFLQ